MSNDALSKLLDRDLFTATIRDAFKDTLTLLEEVVDYGVSLVPRAFDSSEMKIPDIVIILTFLKQAVSNLDAIHILAEKGATTACDIILRSFFELSVYLDWVFKENTVDRATFYFVWEARQKLYWALCYTPGTAEYKAHETHMKGQYGTMALELDPFLLKEEIKIQTAKLQSVELNSYSRAFDAIKKGTIDKQWYVPGGAKNLRAMAMQVSREPEYKIFYSAWSKAAHGSTLQQQVRFKGQYVVYEPIRNLTGLDEIFGSTFNLAFHMYRAVLNYYRFGEIENFNRKYEEQWRQRRFSIPTVQYDGATYTISNEQRQRGKQRM